MRRFLFLLPILFATFGTQGSIRGYAQTVEPPSTVVSITHGFRMGPACTDLGQQVIFASTGVLVHHQGYVLTSETGLTDRVLIEHLMGQGEINELCLAGEFILVQLSTGDVYTAIEVIPATQQQQHVQLRLLRLDREITDSGTQTIPDGTRFPATSFTSTTIDPGTGNLTIIGKSFETERFEQYQIVPGNLRTNSTGALDAPEMPAGFTGAPIFDSQGNAVGIYHTYQNFACSLTYCTWNLPYVLHPGYDWFTHEPIPGYTPEIWPASTFLWYLEANLPSLDDSRDESTSQAEPETQIDAESLPLGQATWTFHDAAGTVLALGSGDVYRLVACFYQPDSNATTTPPYTATWTIPSISAPLVADPWAPPTGRPVCMEVWDDADPLSAGTYTLRVTDASGSIVGYATVDIPYYEVGTTSPKPPTEP